MIVRLKIPTILLFDPTAGPPADRPPVNSYVPVPIVPSQRSTRRSTDHAGDRGVRYSNGMRP